ncbi:hypothetical protein CAPTEDRAFT_195780 [Capitella teleta]|uniref:Uncharacterized protein n=1 Tax=Capitella teleta TaxID=283909 RepID=R7TH43_CAPTE|nr:hypothetical protein CAPTEDRAFT_195780 [Capitella teleta]|eukprot:ELT93128.1 hypothetical protein CAPTEDRAFT_195780 [Capitella teleta]
MKQPSTPFPRSTNQDRDNCTEQLDKGFSHRNVEEERRVLGMENQVSTTMDPVEKELLEWQAWKSQQPERVYIGSYLRLHDIDGPVSSIYDYHIGRAKGGVDLMGPAVSWRTVLKIFGGVICSVCTFYLLCFWRKKLKIVRIARQLSVHTQTPAWHSLTPVSPAADASGWVRSPISRSLTVVNNRTLQVDSAEETNVAVWDRSFNAGKHVFAILWPREQRVFYGACVSIGVGFNSEQPGGDRESVGLDLVENSICYDGCSIRTYPHGWHYTMMYLSFGSGEEYWGPAADLGQVRRRKQREDPMHVIAAFKKVKGRFCVFYKGQVPDASIARSVETFRGPSTVEVSDLPHVPSAYYSPGIINPAVDADVIDIRF